MGNLDQQKTCHIVVLEFKHDLLPPQVDDIFSKIFGLQTAIPDCGMLSCYRLTNIATADPSKKVDGFVMTFAGSEKRDRYLNDPQHLDVASEVVKNLADYQGQLTVAAIRVVENKALIAFDFNKEFNRRTLEFLQLLHKNHQQDSKALLALLKNHLSATKKSLTHFASPAPKNRYGLILLMKMPEKEMADKKQHLAQTIANISNNYPALYDYALGEYQSEEGLNRGYNFAVFLKFTEQKQLEEFKKQYRQNLEPIIGNSDLPMMQIDFSYQKQSPGLCARIMGIVEKNVNDSQPIAWQQIQQELSSYQVFLTDELQEFYVTINELGNASTSSFASVTPLHG